MAGKVKFQDSMAERRMIEEERRELAPLLELMLDKKIMTRKLIQMDFGIDYKTIRNIISRNNKTKPLTIRKLNYVFAYYLNEEKKALKNLKEWDKHKLEREQVFDCLCEEYRAYYGVLAKYAFQLIKDGYDLRQIIKQK